MKEERRAGWVRTESFAKGADVFLNTVIICDHCLESYFVYKFENIEERFRYCPRCGARMTEVRLMTKREEEAE